MWPLHILLNKFLRNEDGDSIEEKETCCSLVRTYPFKQSVENQDVILPRSHFVDVPHVGQLCSWDCGLACIVMVLRTIGIDQCNIQALTELCTTTSTWDGTTIPRNFSLSSLFVWTVDLAYLLQKYSVSFSFFTVTVGANPDYSVETFYKEQLPNDQMRVDKLFQKAVESGIDIQCRSISSEELSVLILSGNYVAIALVDQDKLSRSWMDDVCVSGLCSGNSGYTGHYVVICGYDMEKDEFEMRDPASSRNYDRVSMECLEEARKSYGTDEDLLLISLEKREVGQKFSL
ncbi:hypothetical protein C5167_002623 [Papaver somniferum]|uniref:Guanylyl cyclase n=1 Tax=Papaver somniferum TaxID=3469 RepID=A0A4Y7KYQ9_PAPSO|nr:hypothetical protein C5167_002623 [Papaver somniferum]